MTYKVSADYNKDDDYVNGISELLGVVSEKFSPEFVPKPFDRSDYLFR